MAREIDIQVTVWHSGIKYLIHQDGILLLVFRNSGADVKTIKAGRDVVESFRAFILDLVEKNWEEVADLAGDAYFLGANSAIVVPAAEFADCSADSIYFSTDPSLFYADEEFGYTDLGLYHFSQELFVEFKLSQVYHPTTSLPILVET